MQWNVLLALCVIGCKAGSKRWCGGRWLPLRGSSAAHTSHNFLSIKVDVRRVSGSSPLSSTIYPVVFRYQEQKPANFAGFLLFWYDFAHFYTENVPIFRAYFRAFLNERKRYLSAFRNCSPNSSIFLSIYIHILDILASKIGFSLRFLKPFSFFTKFVRFAALIRSNCNFMTAHFSPIYRTLSVLLHSDVNVL